MGGGDPKHGRWEPGSPRWDRWDVGILGGGTTPPGLGGGGFGSPGCFSGEGGQGPLAQVSTPVPPPAVSGGHHRHHCGLLPPGRLAPGRGAGAAGSKTSGEAADTGHLPAQQRGAGGCPRAAAPQPQAAARGAAHLNAGASLPPPPLPRTARRSLTHSSRHRENSL